MERIFLAGGLIVFYGVMFYSGIKQKRQGRDSSGRPPLTRALFIPGKAAMGVSWAILVIQLTGFDLRQFDPGARVLWGAVLLLYAGLALCVPIYFQLGQNLKFGLPEEGESTLCMSGLYRVSRNPMYLGFYLMTAASCFYAPSVVNILCACIGIAIHHMTVLSEEKFLVNEHGDVYLDYMARVRRYI